MAFIENPTTNVTQIIQFLYNLKKGVLKKVISGMGPHKCSKGWIHVRQDEGVQLCSVWL